MRDLFHHAALDLFDPGFAVDDDIVEAVGENADDFLEVGVDLAVAARALRAANGQKSKARHLDQRVKNAETRLAQKFQSLFGFAVFHTVNDTHANIVQRQLYVHTKSNGQADSGVCVDGQDLLVGVLLHQKTDNRGADGGLSDTALSGNRKDLGFLFHVRSPILRKVYNKLILLSWLF